MMGGGETLWLERPDGTRLRLAHWPDGERGVVLLLNGRTEFVEKYVETVAALQSRKFAVWTLDWRGQGASTRPLPDPMAHHVRHFDQYLGDLDAVLDGHVRPSLRGRPLVLMGHSMGGHLGARMLARRPELFDRAVLLAPMIDFMRGAVPGWIAAVLAAAMGVLPGGASRYAPGAARAMPQPFEGNRLTSCPERYAADQALVAADPALALGGVTWGWLHAALRSVAVLRDQRVMDRIDMPVLVAIAGDDAVVDNRAIRRFTLRLRRGKSVVVAGARHELLREADAHRLALWAAIDAFLEPVGA